MTPCPACGTEFEPKNKAHRYCSPFCTPSAKKRFNDKLNAEIRRRVLEASMVSCPTCGIRFHPHAHTQVYCRAECRPWNAVVEPWYPVPGEPLPDGWCHPKVEHWFRMNAHRAM